MVRVLLFTLALFFLLFPFSVSFAEKSNRVEDLFIWKISEELKLSVKEENKLTNLVHDLNKRKLAATNYVQALIDQMSRVQTGQSGGLGYKKLLQEYKKALQKYSEISIEEVQRIEKIFPPNKAAKYFVIKSELSQKIKNLLATQDHSIERPTEKTKSVPARPLPEPKIIEE